MMHRGGWLFFIFSLATVLLFAGCCKAEMLAGLATAQPTNVSIFVLPLAPIITIISPINGTYITNISLLLNFTSTPADNYWYNLDNGPNQTISLPGGLFNVSSQGSHTLYLYANKSGSIGRANVTFSVNLTLFRVIYEEYKGAFRGDSTDFDSYTYEQMLNMYGVVLQNTNYGRMTFNRNISLPNDSNINDYILDLDSYTNISFSRIRVDGTALPNFDVPATLWFYNLTLMSPRVLRDGMVCLSCLIEDYSSGVLRVSVPGAGIYTLDEIPKPIMIGPSPGGSSPGPSCKTAWKCTNWTECENKTQKRVCVKAVEGCEADRPKPAESLECEERRRPIEIEFPISPDCCMFGLCWFKFIVCWYWWVLLLIVSVVYITLRRLFVCCPRRREEPHLKIKFKLKYKSAPVYSEQELSELSFMKSGLKDQIRNLDAEFKRGTIGKTGYKKTRSRLLAKLKRIEAKLEGSE